MQVGMSAQGGKPACHSCLKHVAQTAGCRSTNTHLDEQTQHNAGLQEGKVLAQAVAGSLNEWDKLHIASTIMQWCGGHWHGHHDQKCIRLCHSSLGGLHRIQRR